MLIYYVRLGLLSIPRSIGLRYVLADNAIHVTGLFLFHTQTSTTWWNLAKRYTAQALKMLKHECGRNPVNILR